MAYTKQQKAEIAKQKKLYDIAKLKGDESGMRIANAEADKVRGFDTTTIVKDGKYKQVSTKKLWANTAKAPTLQTGFSTPAIPSLKNIPAPPKAQLKPTPQITRNASAITKITPEQQAKNQKIATQELQGKNGNVASFARGASLALLDPFGLRKLTPFGSNPQQEKASAQNTYNVPLIKNPRAVAQGLKPVETANLKGTYEGLGEFVGSSVGVDPIGIGLTKGIQKGTQIANKSASKIPMLVNGKTKFVDAPTQISKDITKELPSAVVSKNATAQPQVKVQPEVRPQAPISTVQPVKPNLGIKTPQEQVFAQNVDIPKAGKVETKLKDLGADTNLFNEQQKVSRTRSNTFENSPMFDEADKAHINAEDYKYDVVSEKQSIAQAKQRLGADFDGEVKDLPQKSRFDGVDTDTAMGILEQYKSEARQTGDYSKVYSWSKLIQERGTEGGQMIQAFVKYTRTPEGAVVKAQQTVAKVERDIEKANPNLIEKVKKETKQVTDAIKKAENETIESLGDILEKTAKARRNNAKPLIYPENPITSVEDAVAKLTDKNYGEIIGLYAESSAKKLANRADALAPKKIRQTSPLQQAFDDMTKELYKIAQETLPKTKTLKQEVKATDILKSAIENKQNYQDVWARAKFELQKKYADNSEAMELFNDFFDKDVIPDFSNKTVNSALDQAVKDLGVDIKDMILNNPQDKTTALKNIKQYIIDNTGATGEEAEALTKQIEAKYVEIVNGKNWTMLENLLRERVKTAPPNEFTKVKQLMNMGAYYSDRYGKAAGTATAKAINKSAKDFSQDLNKIIRQNKGDKQKLLTDIQNYVLYNTDVSGQDAEILAREIADEYGKILKSKTESALKQMFPEAFGKQLPIVNKKSPVQKVMELINMGAYDNEAIKNAIRAKNNLPVLENSEIKAIIENMELSAKQTDPYMKNMYASKAEQIMSDKIPAEFREKFRAMQRLSLILNPKTLITRNPLGNILLGATENIKDIPATAIDKLVSLKTGQRTTNLAPDKLKAQAQGFGQGLKEWGQDIKYGVDTSPSRGQFELPSKRVFKGNFLNSMDMFLRRSLQLGDRPFYQAAYNSRLAELKKLGVAGEELETQARLYALDRVFQNDSTLSKGAVQIRKTLGLPGDLLMPFTQTPANILDKLLDYSPAGLGKAVYQLGSTAGKGTFDQKKFVDTLGRTFTGGGLAMLAYAMFEKGVLTGDLSSNTDVRQAEQLAGKQAYSIKIGDTYYSYDWAQPIAGIFAGVANAMQAGADQEDLATALFDAGISSIDTVFEQSFLSGIMNAFSGYSPATGVGNALLGSTSQATPTLFANIAKTIDPTVRETYNPNILKQQGNKLIARIPLASKLLPEKIDVTGQPISQSQGRGAGNRTFENFLAPQRISQETNDKVNNELLRLQKATGDNAVLLNKADKSIKEYQLSPQEYGQYQREMGQKAYSDIQKLTQTQWYKNMSDSEKANMVSKINKQAKELAQNKILVARGIPVDPVKVINYADQIEYEFAQLSKQKQEKYSLIANSGVGKKDYTYLSTHLDLNDNDSITQDEAKQALGSMNLTKEQKAALWPTINKGWKNNPYK